MSRIGSLWGPILPIPGRVVATSEMVIFIAANLATTDNGSNRLQLLALRTPVSGARAYRKA